MDTQTTPATLDDVRLAVFRQHTQITELLDEVEAHANAVVSGSDEGKALGGALELLDARLVRHTEYVEANLASWLPSPQTEAGQARLAGYAEQRSRMRGLLHDREVFGDLRTVALEVLTCIHELRRYVAAESARLRALN